MTAIVVSCDRWLGFGSKYAVRVDHQEVGRLGRRTKSVRVNVEAGTHRVLVEYNGNRTPTMEVDLKESDEVRLVLAFGSASALAVKASLTPWKQRISEPVGVLPPTS